MKKFFAFLIAGLAIGSSLTYAQSATENEVIQAVLEQNEYLRTT